MFAYAIYQRPPHSRNACWAIFSSGLWMTGLQSGLVCVESSLEVPLKLTLVLRVRTALGQPPVGRMLSRVRRPRPTSQLSGF